MPTAPTAVHAATKVASFHLLLLSEGFRAQDKKEFTRFCTGLSRALFRIAPFSLAEPQISIVSVFKASGSQGVGAAPTNTAFRFTLSAANELRTREPSKILTLIADITPVPIGGKVDIAPPLTGSEVWSDPGTVGTRAVCVVVREAKRAITTTRVYAPADIDDPADDDPDLISMLPFIAMSSWPTLPASVPKYKNPFEAAAAALARELGFITGLEYESELKDAAHEQFDLLLPDPEAPNLVSDRQVRVAGEVDLKNVPWYDLMAPARRARPVSELDHPAVNVAGETGDQELLRFRPVQEAMNTNIVLLRHPKNAANPNDTSALTEVRYQTKGMVQLINDDPHLIEGGGGFRRGIYRPGVECAMRFEGNDMPVGAQQQRVIVPFCAVCTRHLQTELASNSNFRFGGVRILRGGRNCAGRAMPSRLADRLVEDIKTRVVPNVGNMACVECTVFRYENFFREVLKWKDTAKIEIGASSGWYASEIQFPRVGRARLTMFKIWMSALPFLKANKFLWPYAGLGAPGALLFGRMGCLANKMQTLTENDPAGNPVKFTVATNLTLAQVAKLTPGSILQLWTNEALYLSIVRYVVGVQAAAPVFNDAADIGGHSLYYMGNDANGNPLVADQEGTTGLLNASYRTPYVFRIAAQWYDAENVPPVPTPPVP